MPWGGDFMAARGDLANEAGLGSRHPSQDEERPPRPGFVEQVEEPPRIRRHARRKGAPGVARHDVGERLHLIVILDVDTQRERRLDAGGCAVAAGRQRSWSQGFPPARG
jgi:hypothetical protein